ncbi:hypothetical protein GCM10022393_39010 [Aquimarina addita]|uniref:Uncharacterized protein n=1 Tax=Aquimarina addita TaxID=870485 RepID=A0ABP6UWK6_9FLAO
MNIKLLRNMIYVMIGLIGLYYIIFFIVPNYIMIPLAAWNSYQAFSESNSNTIVDDKTMNLDQNNLQNKVMVNYEFLAMMYRDPYFPNHVVDKGKLILIDLCFRIEKQSPQSLSELYDLTQEATEKFNLLQVVFDANNSEIETGARECIGADFVFIAKMYGFVDADVEELIASGEW